MFFGIQQMIGGLVAVVWERCERVRLTSSIRLAVGADVGVYIYVYFVYRLLYDRGGVAQSRAARCTSSAVALTCCRQFLLRHRHTHAPVLFFK
jgi:uncharacterized membrane-anchored protein